MAAASMIRRTASVDVASDNGDPLLGRKTEQCDGAHDGKGVGGRVVLLRRSNSVVHRDIRESSAELNAKLRAPPP